MGAQKGKPTLYELLGIPTFAGSAQLQAAFRQQMNGLESDRASLSGDEFSDRSQLLRVAYTTLADPVSRNVYDRSIEAAARESSVGSGALATSVSARSANGASVEARADALSLRADALSLRADALLMRAHGGVPANPNHGLTALVDAFGSLKRVVRAIGMLAALGVLAFIITRCAAGGSAQRRADFEQKATEQTALQEYFQTHGVRPANMADLELLEASRRRRDKEQGDAERANRQRQQSESQFEQRSRELGREVSERLNQADESNRLRAERQQQLKFEADRLKLESELASSEPERRRLELQRQQVLQKLQQL
jgi:hypothetical protein